MASREGANLNIELDMTPLIRGSAKLDSRLDNGVAGAFKYRSHVSERWMKENAPWTDRTGNARSGLSADTIHVPKKSHTLILFGRVPYQIWLEVRHAGKYAVIIPALIDQGPKLMQTISKLLKRLDGGPTPS